MDTQVFIQFVAILHVRKLQRIQIILCSNVTNLKTVFVYYIPNVKYSLKFISLALHSKKEIVLSRLNNALIF